MAIQSKPHLKERYILLCFLVSPIVGDAISQRLHNWLKKKKWALKNPQEAEGFGSLSDH